LKVSQTKFKELTSVGLKMVVGLLFLTSGCGIKQSSSNNTVLSTGAASKTTANSDSFMEDATPGISLINGTASTPAFKIMSSNLNSSGSFNVIEEKTFDYRMTPSSLGGAPTLTRQEGLTRTPNPSSYQAQSTSDALSGRLSLTLVAPPKSKEMTRTFGFQYQINLAGLILKSTDQVALFSALNSDPYATDFLKIHYTTKNPTIQRFRVSRLSPFPLTGLMPTPSEDLWGNNWFSVVRQRITTVFNYGP
jgi:hypothetical protein